MGVRTIILDDDAEMSLSVVLEDTDLTVSQAIGIALKIYAGELGLDLVKGEIRRIKAEENGDDSGERPKNFLEAVREAIRRHPDKPGVDEEDWPRDAEATPNAGEGGARSQP